MVVLDPSVSGLTPRWVVYQGISFPGSLALKNTPPIPVTRVGCDSWCLAFGSVVIIHPRAWPRDILDRDNTFLLSSVPHTLHVFSGRMDLHWQAGQSCMRLSLVTIS